MDVPVNPPSPGGAAPLAELVVVNGRLSGARRPLTGPLTLFGQAPGCEVRLTVEGVQPLHAALVHGPDGFLLRDLAGDGGVLIDDRPASLAALRHGDEFTVGPFRFRLEAPIPSAEQAVEVERDALRIQGAAVVAQQTALNEEESRLHQQRGRWNNKKNSWRDGWRSAACGCWNCRNRPARSGKRSRPPASRLKRSRRRYARSCWRNATPRRQSPGRPARNGSG